MTTPRVSIVIPNYQHPEVSDISLRALTITEGVDYEVVVVDNGSEPHVVEALRVHRDEGRITTLVEEPINHYFSEGNNIGVRNANPDAEFVLLMNSDVAVVKPDWLAKLVAWADGTAVYWPNVWCTHPTTPSPGPRDIVSAGFAFDPAVEPSHMRPEGFCCLIRRSVWRDLSPDFPWHYGFEEAVALSIRDGAKCGVLSQYPPYLVHREGGSAPGTWSCQNVAVIERGPTGFVNTRVSDIPGWFNGLDIETLDFTLGVHEHDSYLLW